MTNLIGWLILWLVIAFFSYKTKGTIRIGSIVFTIERQLRMAYILLALFLIGLAISIIKAM